MTPFSTKNYAKNVNLTALNYQIRGLWRIFVGS